MNPAKLRHRITFVKPPPDGATDADGFPITDWTPVVSVWASLVTPKGRTFYQAAAVQMERNREFTCRYRDDVDDRMRVRFKNVDYEIVSLNNDDGLNKTLTVICQEVS